MWIYILCDMEGVSGLGRREEAWFWEERSTPDDRARGSLLVTDEINSAVWAALHAGAEEVFVRDCHHGGGNAIDDELLGDPRVHYESKRLPWELTPGLDERFGGLILLGHHARAGTSGAFLPHSWSGRWRDFRINGAPVGEIGMEACYAGHWNVPAVLVQGDEACCAEAAELLPGVVTAPVKRAASFDRAEGLSPQEGRWLTAAKIAEALAKAAISPPAPYRPALPMTAQIAMDSADAAERAEKRPGVRRVDETTVEAQVLRHCEILKWIVGPAAG